MSRQPVTFDVPAAKIVAFAKRAVELWESIEQRADDFQKKFDAPPEARAAYVQACREAIGGEEIYEACKKLMAAYDGAPENESNSQVD